MTWSIERSNAFLDTLKEHKKNAELLRALEKKLARLRDDPRSVGGLLRGELHGWHSTRLVGTFRLLFMIDDQRQTVLLGPIRHRKGAYD